MIEPACPSPLQNLAAEPPSCVNAQTLWPADERAQTTIEFLGCIPLLIFTLMVVMQTALVMYALVSVQSIASDAAHGMPAADSVQQVPPAWRRRVHVSTRDSRAVVRFDVPMLVSWRDHRSIPVTTRAVVVRA